MTEGELLAAINPTPMLKFMRGKASDRKSRLFAVSCDRSVSDLVEGDTNREALDVIERYADGTSTLSEVKVAGREIFNLAIAFTDQSAWDFATNISLAGIALAADEHGDPTPPKGLGDYIAAEKGERAAQCKLFHDIFGNPFRPIAFLPEWRTSTVLALAQQM